MSLSLTDHLSGRKNMCSNDPWSVVEEQIYSADWILNDEIFALVDILF